MPAPVTSKMPHAAIAASLVWILDAQTKSTVVGQLPESSGKAQLGNHHQTSEEEEKTERKGANVMQSLCTTMQRKDTRKFICTFVYNKLYNEIKMWFPLD